jgi:hypothetical protein
MNLLAVSMLSREEEANMEYDIHGSGGRVNLEANNLSDRDMFGGGNRGVE